MFHSLAVNFTMVTIVRLFAVLIGCWVFIWGVKNSVGVDQELSALLNNDMVAYAAIHGMNLTKIKVETSDGWLLEVHRIRSLKVYDANFSAPVYLSHGFGCSSFDYMANPRNESIAFILADAGYDVWLVNYRANKFSNRMRKNGEIVTPQANDYYRATWQYMGERDVPAVLDKIQEVTKKSKFYLIGQSMGTTILFAFLSENHRYDDKIALFASIVPVIKFGEDTALTLRTLFNIAPTVPKVAVWPLFDMLFGRQFLTSQSSSINTFTEFMQSQICKWVPQACELLTNVMFQTQLQDAIKDNPHIRSERMPLYVSKYPAGVTAMNMYQFARQYRRNPWTKMDYDEVSQTGITNMQEYNQTKPPAYNFSAVGVPLLMYYAKNDIFTGVATDLQVLSELGVPSTCYRIIEGNRLSHHDTLWGWDARCWIYDHIIEKINALELSQSNTGLVHYRSETVPTFIETLKFHNGCTGLKNDE